MRDLRRDGDGGKVSVIVALGAGALICMFAHIRRLHRLVDLLETENRRKYEVMSGCSSCKHQYLELQRRGL